MRRVRDPERSRLELEEVPPLLHSAGPAVSPARPHGWARAAEQVLEQGQQPPGLARPKPGERRVAIESLKVPAGAASHYNANSKPFPHVQDAMKIVIAGGTGFLGVAL